MTEGNKIVLLGCAHSAGEVVADLAARGLALPAHVEWVNVPCGSTIDELLMLRAFESGAGQVMVLACYNGACRSVDGSLWAEKRARAARALLEEAGIAGWRLRFCNIAPNMAADLPQWIEEFREPVVAEESK